MVKLLREGGCGKGGSMNKAEKGGNGMGFVFAERMDSR